MDFWTNKHWFAIRSKTGRENHAASAVEVAGHEVFQPRLMREVERNGRVRTSIRPLFAGYFFSRFAPAPSLDEVKHARHVLHVVSSGTLPLAVDQEVIEALRARLDADGCMRLAPQPVPTRGCCVHRARSIARPRRPNRARGRRPPARGAAD